MKAILTKYLGATETKPSRIKVTAEGVSYKLYSKNSLEDQLLGQGKPAGTHHIHAYAAELFCDFHGWNNALVSGGTPNPDVWCHCLVPHSERPFPVSVNEELAEALEAVRRAVPDVLRRECLDRAGSFLRGQELVVAQARTLLAQGVSHRVGGETVVSGYHLTLLIEAVKLLDEGGCPAKPAEKPLWEIDTIQFPRLIAEAECVGLFDTSDERYLALLDEMGLTAEECAELIDRAVATWDAHKERLLTGGDLRKPAAPVAVVEALECFERLLTDAEQLKAPFRADEDVLERSRESLERALRSYHGIEPRPADTYVVEHTHRHGTSVFVVQSDHYPSEEEVVYACNIDFEPDAEETIEITLSGIARI